MIVEVEFFGGLEVRFETGAGWLDSQRIDLSPLILQRFQWDDGSYLHGGIARCVVLPSSWTVIKVFERRVSNTNPRAEAPRRCDSSQ